MCKRTCPTSSAMPDVSDIQRDAAEIKEALECAESCETKKDLIENLESVITYAEGVRKQARELLARAKKTEG